MTRRKPPIPLPSAGLCLTPAELVEITGKRRAGKQAEVLNELGITHKIRPDNTVLVSRAHLEQVLGGDMTRVKMTSDQEPNFDDLR